MFRIVASGPIRRGIGVVRRLALDTKNMSPLDVEKELFRLKRTMGAHYSRGAYGEALETAKTLESEVVNLWGKNTAVHASCMVDIGTMLKALGNAEEAMEQYQKALPLYETLYGKNNKSYINTLTNVGTLYKFIAETKEAENEYLENLGKAEEALEQALSLRKELQGDRSKEVLVNENHLALVLKAKGSHLEAQEKLRRTLSICREDHGEWDTITSLTLNNLGTLLKQRGVLDEAEECYLESLKIRKEVIGNRHKETIVTMHNLAELYQTKGDQGKADEIRKEILSLVESEYRPEDWCDDGVVSSLPESVRLKEGSLVDKRPTLDDILKENTKRGGSGFGLG